jgi:ArsR family transcriptional regulator
VKRGNEASDAAAVKRATDDAQVLQCDCDAVHEDVVGRVRDAMPQRDDFHRLANLYKMFSDPTRVRILWALHSSEMCVCDLAVLLNMTKSAISHQLKSLRLSNLVKYDKRGKVVYYSLADEHVEDIFDKGFEHINE